MRTQQLERNLVERVAMGDLMRRRARDSGSLPALVDFYHNERRTVTYSELNKKVNKLANALMREGIKQGDKLAMLAVNQIDVVVTYFACYKLGVIAVPINFMQSVADVTFNLEHSGSKVVVFDPLLSDLVFASTNNNDDIHFTIQLGQYKIISFFAKKARGLMARYILENRVEDVEGLKNFDVDGYQFSEEQSSSTELVFLRNQES
jgi:long-chain acyl-CoA synthetase